MAQTQRSPYERQQRLSLIGFIAELPSFVAVSVAAVRAGSLLVWLNFIVCLCGVTDSGFVTLLSRKLKRNLKYEYNYGVGKIEAISSLCCEGILILGVLIMLASSVYELIYPKEPSEVLIYVVLLKIVNVLSDANFLNQQYKITKSCKSELTTAKFYSVLKTLAFDAAALVSIFVCWVFRSYRASWYFSPVMCIILAGVFFASAILRIKKAVGILTDRTLPEEQQMKILKVLAKFNDRYEEFEFLGSRISGETAFIDLHIRFRDDTSYSQIKSLCGDISSEMKKQISNSKVSIVVESDKQ